MLNLLSRANKLKFGSTVYSITVIKLLCSSHLDFLRDGYMNEAVIRVVFVYSEQLDLYWNVNDSSLIILHKSITHCIIHSYCKLLCLILSILFCFYFFSCSEWVLGNREDLVNDITAELQPENGEVIESSYLS